MRIVRPATGSPEAHRAMLEAGFPAGSEPTWAYSYRAFWDPFQRILREEIEKVALGAADSGPELIESVRSILGPQLKNAEDAAVLRLRHRRE